MLKIGIIGAGKVGTALAVLLGRKGYPVTGVFSRTRASAEKLSVMVRDCRICDSYQQVVDGADLVFITTPDAAIGPVTGFIAWRPGKSVVHCSGADSTAVLQRARTAGAMTGGFHPLQTFAGIKEAIENIPGSTFALEAEEPLLSTLKTMAGDLGGSCIVLKPGDKPAYHAAAVFVCNYLVTLLKMSTDLWKTFDIPPEQAVKALMPLVRGTLHNIETIGIPGCLTGPIARGDAGTVSKHLEVLREKAPELIYAYKELGLQTVPIALAKGTVNGQQAKEMELVLSK